MNYTFALELATTCTHHLTRLKLSFCRLVSVHFALNSWTTSKCSLGSVQVTNLFERNAMLKTHLAIPLCRILPETPEFSRSKLSLEALVMASHPDSVMSPRRICTVAIVWGICAVSCTTSLELLFYVKNTKDKQSFLRCLCEEISYSKKKLQ